MPISTLIRVFPLFWACADARGPTPLLGIQLVRHEPKPLLSPRYKVREVIVQADPEMACPNGFEQSGANCVQLESVPVSTQCPPGWQYSDDKLSCIGYTAIAPETTCDEGTVGSETCIRQRSVPKIMTCPVDYSLDQNMKQCSKRVHHAALDVCPAGLRYANGACITVRTEMPRTRCPAGFDLRDGACHKIIEKPVLKVCPPGYTANGKEKSCEKLVETLPSRFCPAGTELRGADCVVEHHASPTFVCTKGVMVEGNRCIIDHFAAPQWMCPPGYKMNSISQSCEKDDVKKPLAECTKGTLYNPLTNQCGSANKLKQPNLACPPNYRFVGKHSCVAHLEEQPYKVCPDGFDLISKDQCRHQEQVLPEGRCPEGSYLMGKFCVAVQSQPFVFKCEPGAVLTGKMCIAKAYAEAHTQCPPGFDVAPSREVCVAEAREAPTIACPPGTAQRADNTGLLCMAAMEVPSSKSCPPSMTPTGVDCLETIFTVPEVKCPPEYFEDLNTGRCFTSSEIPQRTFCPVGFKLVGSRCVKKESRQLVPVCPPGFEMTMTGGSGEVCIRETVVPPTELCSLGFELDNGICIAKKLQYEFDETPGEDYPTVLPVQEDLKDLESPTPLPLTTTTTTSPVTIEVRVDRPVVQKGLVMRNEPVILSGPASEVARQQAILAAGGSLNDLQVQGVHVDYIPPVLPQQPTLLSQPNLLSRAASTGGLTPVLMSH